MNPNPRPVPVPPAWRDAVHHLRLAVASEEHARACASVQDVTGTVRALLTASRAARLAAQALGQAAGQIDDAGNVSSRPGLAGQKERTR